MSPDDNESGIASSFEDSTDWILDLGTRSYGRVLTMCTMHDKSVKLTISYEKRELR